MNEVYKASTLSKGGRKSVAAIAMHEVYKASTLPKRGRKGVDAIAMHEVYKASTLPKGEKMSLQECCKGMKPVSIS